MFLNLWCDNNVVGNGKASRVTSWEFDHWPNVVPWKNVKRRRREDKNIKGTMSQMSFDLLINLEMANLKKKLTNVWYTRLYTPPHIPHIHLYIFHKQKSQMITNDGFHDDDGQMIDCHFFGRMEWALEYRTTERAMLWKLTLSVIYGLKRPKSHYEQIYQTQVIWCEHHISRKSQWNCL